MDDEKSSHFSPKVNGEFTIWWEEKHGSDDLSHIAVNIGKRHDHVGMNIDHSRNKSESIDMMEHVDQMKE